MNLDNIKEHSFPFQHWEMENCLNSVTLKEISSGSSTEKLSPNISIDFPVVFIYFIFFTF